MSMTGSRIQNQKNESSEHQKELLEHLDEVRQAIYRGKPDKALYALVRLETCILHSKDVIYQVGELAQAITTVIQRPSADSNKVIEDIIEEINEYTNN